MSIYGDTGGSDGMADTLSTAAAKPAGGGGGGAAAATSGWLHELTIRDIALGCTMLAVLVLIVSGGSAGPPGPPGTGLPGGGAAVHYSHCNSYTSSTDFQLDDLVCDDNKASSLDSCTYVDNTEHNCGSSEGVWISCTSSTCDGRDPPPPPPPWSGTIDQLRLVSTDGSERLVQSPTQGGILQAHVDGEWGYVCDDIFDTNNNAAEVACRQLGFNGGMHCNADSSPPGAFPAGGAVGDRPHQGFSLDNVQCSGSEQALGQCSAVGAEQSNCATAESVFLICGQGARCPPPPPIAGLRLTNADNPSIRTAGILEASLDGITWGPVCDDIFDQNDNAVEAVCHQLGMFRGPGTFSHCDTGLASDNFILVRR